MADYFAIGGEAHGGVVSLSGSGNMITDCRLRANSYFATEQENVDDRGRITTWNRFDLGILVSTKDATNFVVEDSDLFSQFQVFDSECSSNSYGRITGNIIYDGAEVIRMCGTNQMIFEGNDATNGANLQMILRVAGPIS